uniref:EFTUD2 domain-containing protein n=1 Tax=Gongylonema pulchrum TaxID=637853 RepID=A0A183D631_9BILA
LVDEEDSAVREASADEDNLSDEAGDEMLEEEMEDERSDAEEIDEEGEFDLPPPYRRPTFHPQRARPHLEPANDESDDDDGVILIEDAGEMEHSHSSAYLSIDEAQGDDRRHPDMETGAAEAGDLRQGSCSGLMIFFVSKL